MPGPGGGHDHMSHGGRPHGRMYRGGWYHPPIFFGGGCLSGLFSMFLLPIFLIIFLLIIISSSVSTAFSDISSGGTVKYNENSNYSHLNVKKRSIIL